MNMRANSEDEVPVRVPKNIYDWLSEVARHMGLTADKLASIILAQFWEINRALTQSIPGLQVRPVGDLANKLALIKEYKALVRRFLIWADNKGLTDQDLTHEHISRFLEEYTMDKTLSKNTRTKYRYTLNTYLRLVKEYGLTRKEILGEG
jgi:hypothetical protein